MDLKSMVKGFCPECETGITEGDELVLSSGEYFCSFCGRIYNRDSLIKTKDLEEELDG